MAVAGADAREFGPSRQFLHKKQAGIAVAQMLLPFYWLYRDTPIQSGLGVDLLEYRLLRKTAVSPYSA